jgi:hypothetical protein
MNTDSLTVIPTHQQDHGFFYRNNHCVCNNCYGKTEVWRQMHLSYICQIISVIIHRILLCSLAAHKGLLLARVTSWPNWYHAAKCDRHIWLLQLHTQYGSAVRFGPNSVSFNTLSAVDSIYTPRDAKICKGDWYQCVKDFAYGDDCTITAHDKTRHALKRRILSQAFSERVLREHEHWIKLLTGRWLQQLTRLSGDGRSVDLGAWSNYIVFDILGDLCYSKDFGLIHSEENRHAIKLLPRTTRS